MKKLYFSIHYGSGCLWIVLYKTARKRSLFFSRSISEFMKSNSSSQYRQCSAVSVTFILRIPLYHEKFMSSLVLKTKLRSHTTDHRVMWVGKQKMRRITVRDSLFQSCLLPHIQPARGPQNVKYISIQGNKHVNTHMKDRILCSYTKECDTTYHTIL